MTQLKNICSKKKQSGHVTLQQVSARRQTGEIRYVTNFILCSVEREQAVDDETCRQRYVK